MTLYHFFNCAALTFVPPLVVFKTQLSESNRFWICGSAALVYLLTKLVEMILLATFVPLKDGDQFSILHELMRSFVGCVDLVGLHYALNRREWLPVGLGWATTDALVVRLIPLWIGARSLEFDWEHIQSALQANITLLSFITLAALVRMSKRKVAHQSSLLMGTIATHRFVVPFVSALLRSNAQLWLALVVEAALVIVITLIARHLYNQRESY